MLVTGTAGTLSLWGTLVWDLAGPALHEQPQRVPFGWRPDRCEHDPDTTAAGNRLSFQAPRSGSTAETVQILDMLMEALN